MRVSVTEEATVTRGRWRPHWMVIYGAALIVMLLGFAKYHDPATGFTYLIQFGSERHPLELAEVRRTPHAHHLGAGYDGQFYAQIATSPFLGDRSLHVATDGLAYRARRVLMSWSAYLLGLGRVDWILQAFALQNLLWWLVLAWLLTRWFPPNSAAHFVAWTGCLFTHGTVAAMLGALMAVPSALLLVVAMRYLEHDRPRNAAASLGLAVLARETNVLMAGSLVPLSEPGSLRTRARRLAIRLGVFLLPVCLWYGYLTSRGLHVGRAGRGNFQLVGAGYLEAWQQLLEAWARVGWSGATVSEFAVLVGFAVQAAYLAVRPRVTDAWWRVGATYVVLMLFLGPAVWEGMPGAATRVLLPMTLTFNVLASEVRRGRLPLLVLGNLAVVAGFYSLGALNPLADVPVDKRSRVSVFAADDTFVRRVTPEANFGRDATLRVRGTDRLRALVRFERSAYEQATRYDPVEGVWLRLRIDHLAASWPEEDPTFALSLAPPGWSETGASWSCPTRDRPCSHAEWMAELPAAGPGAEPAALFAVMEADVGEWVELDVTEHVRAFAAGELEELSWLIRQYDGPPTLIALSSSESRHRPELHVRLR